VVGTDVERDKFLHILRKILREVRDVDQLRDHARFQALLGVHGTARVRGWIILEGLRLARQVALDEHGLTADPGDAWLGRAVLQRLCVNAAYLSERMPN
jgi:hypothetical protein